MNSEFPQQNRDDRFFCQSNSEGVTQKALALVLQRPEFHKEKMAQIDTGSQQQSIHHLNSHLKGMLGVLHTGRDTGGAVWLCSVTIKEQRGTGCWEQLREW